MIACQKSSDPTVVEFSVDLGVHYFMEDKLRNTTYLLHFYGWLARGLLAEEDRNQVVPLCNESFDRIRLMRDLSKWDGRYDLVVDVQTRVENLLTIAKSKIDRKQIASDETIAHYVFDHPDFDINGIALYDFRKLMDISRELKLGYMLHDVYHGYPAAYYRFSIDCLDYLYSATYFYNEAYDYYLGRKASKKYSDPEVQSLHFTEVKYIQTSEEVAFRNFRESFINLIFFVESFINSVGYHGYLSEVTTDQEAQNQLKGVQRVSPKGFKNYSTLKQRIENISRILGGSSIDCTKEPFKSYLETNVELRNQYVHSSAERGKSYVSLDEWKKRCDDMIDITCCDIIKAFWKSCFPGAGLPIVILNTFHGNSFKGRPGMMYAEPQ